MFLYALAAAAALSQSAPVQSPPTFRAGVELVRLDVRVTGADGRPIRDLRQDEIEVVDGGSLPIVFFQHIQEPEGSFAETASHTVAGEVSTNQGAARGQLYLILFDQLHITPGNEQRARLAAQKFVTTRLRPGDRVALYALPGPGPQIAFTADARRVAAALPSVHGTAEPRAYGALGSMTRYEAFEIVRGNEVILQRVAERFQRQAGSDAQTRGTSALSTGTLPLTELVKEDARKIANTADGESRAVLARVSDVLRPLRAVEGRKTILFISEGFQSDRLSREIEMVAAAAAESYSVVHAFDINRREVDVTADEPVGADQATNIHDKLSPLGTLAAETGGSLVLDAAARADQAFAAIADQSPDYYLIGFLPKAHAQPGEYRRVSVRVKRAGARVNSRTGFALSDPTAHLDRQQALQRAMAAPFAQQGLPVQYTTYTLRGNAPGTQTVVLSLETELPVASSQEAHAADVVFAVHSVADGRVAASGKDVIALPTQPRADGTTGTGTFRVQFDLQAGDYLMRVAVREPGGLVGTADRRFTVRALDGPGVVSGDLLVTSGRGDLPVRATAYTADGLRAALPLYARTTEQLASARVVIDLVPIGENIAIVSGFADFRDAATTGRGAAREASVELPLQSVAPGAYLARARVTVDADTVAEAVREVVVRAGQRPTAATEDNPTFDAREVASTVLAREFMARLVRQSSAAGGDGRRALDRLAAADFPAAIAAFEAVLRVEPRDAAAAFLLGWAYHGAGDDRQAISAWRRSAFLEPTFVPAHLALVDLFIRLSQPTLALQAVRAGLAALPESPELIERLAHLERR
jgi:VWFA-related protein